MAENQAQIPLKVEDAMLEEACRQWYAFILEDAERSDGAGFAYFYHQLREQLLNDPDFMSNFPPPELAEGLPELCFTVLRSTGELIGIKRGESGYYLSDWNTEDRARNQELADESNRALGVTDAQRRAMEAGSMFGWDCPGADPAAYEQEAPQQMGGMELA